MLIRRRILYAAGSALLCCNVCSPSKAVVARALSTGAVAGFRRLQETSDSGRIAEQIDPPPLDGTLPAPPPTLPPIPDQQPLPSPLPPEQPEPSPTPAAPPPPSPVPPSPLPSSPPSFPPVLNPQPTAVVPAPPSLPPSSPTIPIQTGPQSNFPIPQEIARPSHGQKTEGLPGTSAIATSATPKSGQQVSTTAVVEGNARSGSAAVSSPSLPADGAGTSSAEGGHAPSVSGEGDDALEDDKGAIASGKAGYEGVEKEKTDQIGQGAVGNSKESTGMGFAAIVTVALAGVAVIIIIAAAIFTSQRRKKERNSSRDSGLFPPSPDLANSYYPHSSAKSKGESKVQVLDYRGSTTASNTPVERLSLEDA